MNATFLNDSDTANEWEDNGSSTTWGAWSRSEKEDSILLVLAVFASISAFISIYLTIQFFVSYRNRDKTSDMLSYFQITMSICVILNLIATLSSSTYILWVMNVEIPIFYALHESHTFRTITTLSWHLSKVFLFYIFNGKIYYSFLNSLYSYSKASFIGANIFVSFSLAVCLSASLPYAYVQGADKTKQGLGYNVFRYTYIALTLWILIAFNKRLYTLCAFTYHLQPTVEMVNSSSNQTINPKKQKDENVESSVESPPASPSNSDSNSIGNSFEMKCDITETANSDRCNSESKVKIRSKSSDRDQTGFFMEVLVKNSILWIVITIANVAVGVMYYGGLHWWFIYNVKGVANEVTLSFPLLSQGIDAWINTLCILLTCSFGSSFYDIICKCQKPKVDEKKKNKSGNQSKGCHGCCKSCCQNCAEKYS